MSGSEVERLVAKALVQSLIKRFTLESSGNYTAILTEDELNALRMLADVEPTPGDKPRETPSAPRFGAPAIISASDLNFSCLDAKPDPEGDVLAIDFGTAFSKAAVWKDGAAEPTPLGLRDQVADISGLMLESYVYVTDGVLYFGPQAEAVFRAESAAGRKLFDSPKGELSVLKGSSLSHSAPAEIDPTGKLTRRDLLTLYLAYLAGATSAALEAEGCERHILRRYAIPVWEGDKLDNVSSVLRRELLDAQILADSLPMDVWRRGLAVEDAVRLMKTLRGGLTDERRMAATFIGDHVLEAAAAAAAVAERFSDHRPVALVLDVGAGTTDVGLYRFALPSQASSKIFPFQHGRGASQLAGNQLDQQIIRFIKQEAGVDPDSADGARVSQALVRDIRAHKVNLFDTGFVDIEELDGRRFLAEDFLNSKPAKDFQANLRKKITTILDPVGFARMDNPDGLYGVITGGGAQASIFREVLQAPFELTDGAARFERIDIEPQWLEVRRPELKPIFPQLAVSVGACSPDLPEERNAITDASAAPRRVAEVTYR